MTTGNRFKVAGTAVAFSGLVLAAIFISTPRGRALDRNEELDPKNEQASSVVQIVALDECDPATFNAALGPDFCKNVAVGAATKFGDFFAKAAAGTPDPNWDFEPDVVHIKKGTTLSVVDQGGEPPARDSVRAEPSTARHRGQARRAVVSKAQQEDAADASG